MLLSQFFRAIALGIGNNVYHHFKSPLKKQEKRGFFPEVDIHKRPGIPHLGYGALDCT